MNFVKTIVLAMVMALVGCTNINSLPQQDTATMARAVKDGTQFGPSVNAIFDSVNDIGNTGGCGSTRTYVEKSDPVISKAADVNNKTGAVTYEYTAGTSGVGKCVGK